MPKKLIAAGGVLAVLLVGTAWVAARPEAEKSPPKVRVSGPQTGLIVISVDGMDCPSCAKKVVARVNQVAGVAKCVADTEASKLNVSAQAKASPSPRAMWDAVEKAGFKPLKIDGPAGTFTARPEK